MVALPCGRAGGGGAAVRAGRRGGLPVRSALVGGAVAVGVDVGGVAAAGAVLLRPVERVAAQVGVEGVGVGPLLLDDGPRLVGGLGTLPRLVLLALRLDPGPLGLRLRLHRRGLPLLGREVLLLGVLPQVAGVRPVLPVPAGALLPLPTSPLPADHQHGDDDDRQHDHADDDPDPRVHRSAPSLGGGPHATSGRGAPRPEGPCGVGTTPARRRRWAPLTPAAGWRRLGACARRPSRRPPLQRSRRATASSTSSGWSPSPWWCCRAGGCR